MKKADNIQEKELNRQLKYNARKFRIDPVRIRIDPCQKTFFVSRHLKSMY